MIGVIDVGGGMRGSFGAGAFDYFMDRGIKFDYCIGVSAGSANLVAYLGGQQFRNFDFYSKYSFRKEYMSMKNLVTTGSYLDLEYIYGDLSNEGGEAPLDYDAFMANPAQFVIVATEALTGNIHYFTKDDLRRNDYGPIKASSCVPVIDRPYFIDGVPYFDGGMSDPIPYRKALDDGCDKLVIILTRPKNDFRDPKRDVRSARILSKFYPRSGKRLYDRAETYNRQLSMILKLEEEGRACIIAPDDIGNAKTLTKDLNNIKYLYRQGLVKAKKAEAYLGC
jgi:predicted patatin/cPLA2 family phospholipase